MSDSTRYNAYSNKLWFLKRKIDVDSWGATLVFKFQSKEDYSENIKVVIAQLIKRFPILSSTLECDDSGRWFEKVNHFVVQDVFTKIHLNQDNVDEILIEEEQKDISLLEKQFQVKYINLAGNNSDCCLISMHHFLYDPMSLGYLIRVIEELFQLSLDSRETHPVSAENTVRECVNDMQAWSKSDSSGVSRVFWCDTLNKSIQKIPTDFPFSHQKNSMGSCKTEAHLLSMSLSEKMIILDEQGSTTNLFNVLAYASIEAIGKTFGSRSLSFETGRRDSTSISGRTSLVDKVGFLVDMFPLYINLNDVMRGVAAFKKCANDIYDFKVHGAAFNALKYHSGEEGLEEDVNQLIEPEMFIYVVPSSVNSVPAEECVKKSIYLDGRRDFVANEREKIHKFSLALDREGLQFNLKVDYSCNTFKTTTIKKFVGNLATEIEYIVGELLQQKPQKIPESIDCSAQA